MGGVAGGAGVWMGPGVGTAPHSFGWWPRNCRDSRSPRNKQDMVIQYMRGNAQGSNLGAWFGLNVSSARLLRGVDLAA